MSSACEYCGSRCDDWRGNCGACGAPKPHMKYDDFLVSKEWARTNLLDITAVREDAESYCLTADVLQEWRKR